MKDQTFLHSLADFTDLKPTYRLQQNDAQNKHRMSVQSRSSNISLEGQLDLGNNQKLIKNFKELRQQLKESHKNNHIAKNKLIEKQTEIERLKLMQMNYITLNHQLKNQLQHLKHSNEDYKGKLQLLKDMAKNCGKFEQQTQFLKITVNDLRNKLSKVQTEKNKMLQMSIVQKVELQEKIKKFEAKQNSEFQYVQEMQMQISKLREKNIKLENQFKKLQIKYEEQVYNGKWANGNFQKQHLQDQLKQSQLQNQQLLAKHKKQKQKRYQLEKRVLELEQTSGLWIVKAETYQVENKALQKKCKKVEKKLEQIKEQSDKKLSQILTLQQKFVKSNAIAQQLIARVKRQLYGDMVALAKSCQFKLNKLKQQKQLFFKSAQNQQNLRKSIVDAKARSKSKQKLQIKTSQEKQTYPQIATVNLRQKFQDCQLKPISQNICDKQKDTLKKSSSYTNMNQPSQTPLCQIENIEARIKRERDQMQKKIRQKMLYRKIEVAHSPQKHKLRQDYFKLFQY